MINIAILGFGVVGSGVAEVIFRNSKELASRLDGEELNIKYILDKREFPDHPLGNRVVNDIDVILNDEDVFLVVETMGGLHPAYDFSKKALLAGKSVVTSNKEVVASCGAELLEIARNNNIGYLFEASVGGGIPIIRPMWQCLAANKIERIAGILNGTCNYILTKMEKEKTDFETALCEAQALGYAERNPAADVEGMDTCRKISILTSLAFGKHVYPEKIQCEGITHITYDDILFARKHGYAIKLLGTSKKDFDGKVYVLTAPFFVSEDNEIAGVNDVYNGIQVEGNVVGDVLFCGRGAGSLPTASAVMADVLDVIRDCRKTIGWKNEEADFLGDISNNVTDFYVRTKADESTVKAVFGDVKTEKAGDFTAFFTGKMKQSDAEEKIARLGAETVKIRVLD
ncbi:MAG: homoserine dehydrogenase [Clostridia bacterium]|nr:homoserine dehydrogenase [Clostridia bacterium]